MNKKERTASKEMCDFLILNISSLQLIPVNMIVYRQQYGEKDMDKLVDNIGILSLLEGKENFPEHTQDKVKRLYNQETVSIILQ